MDESTLPGKKGRTSEAQPVPPHYAFTLESSQQESFGYERAMAKRFGPLLRELIKGTGLSIRKWSALVGSSNGEIFNVIAGRRTPPREELAKWWQSFQDHGVRLSPAKQLEFYELASLEHAPADVAILVERLRADLLKKERQIDRLTRRVIEIELLFGVAPPRAGIDPESVDPDHPPGR